jgi:hypothetical protein
MTRQIPPEVTREIEDHLYAGKKIAAIKLYRAHTDLGLKESKEFVEALEQDLRVREPGRFTASSTGKGCLGSFVVGVLGILAIVIVLRANLH